MKHKMLLFALLSLLLLGGCGLKEQDPIEGKIKIGLVLSESGLGDQSFSDIAFAGLVKSRDEDGVIIEYAELAKTGTFEKGFVELAENGNNIIIGLGYQIQEDLEKVASIYPDIRFILIDAVSELENVTSITYKEDEGSMLAGIVAATVSKSQTIGFIGGLEVPVIQRFEHGFVEGAKSVNPDINVLIKYIDTFDEDAVGATAASEMIANDADVLYAAAGFAGSGMLKEAERKNVYAIGVDSDQFFFAEKAVITSMMKNLDVTLYDIIHEYKETGEIPTGHLEIGLADQGVGLAPFRAWDLSETQTESLEKVLESAQKQIIERGTLK